MQHGTSQLLICLPATSCSTSPSVQLLMSRLPAHRPPKICLCRPVQDGADSACISQASHGDGINLACISQAPYGDGAESACVRQAPHGDGFDPACISQAPYGDAFQHAVDMQHADHGMELEDGTEIQSGYDGQERYEQHEAAELGMPSDQHGAWLGEPEPHLQQDVPHHEQLASLQGYLGSGEEEEGMYAESQGVMYNSGKGLSHALRTV